MSEPKPPRKKRKSKRRWPIAKPQHREMFMFLSRDLLGLTDAISQSKQGLAPDPDLKVRTLLDRAAKKIEGRFNDQPRVEVALRQTIGSAYLGIDATEEAERHLNRALELKRCNSWEPTPILLELSELNWKRMRFEQAAELATEAYETSLEIYGEDHPQTIETMFRLSSICTAQKKYAEAEALLSCSIGILRSTRKEEDVDLMRHESVLAALYGQQGDHAKSARMLSDLVERQQRLLPEDHVYLQTNRMALGRAYMKLGQYADAEPLLRESLDVTRQAWGNRHSQTLSVSLLLSQLLTRQEKFEEAMELQRSLLDVCEEQFGRDDARTRPYRTALAGTIAMYAQKLAFGPTDKASKYAALELAEQAIELAPPQHKGSFRSVHGMVHERCGHWEVAAEIFEEMSGDEPHRLGPYGFSAAVAYWQSGRHDKARKQYGVSLRALDEGHFSRR